MNQAITVAICIATFRRADGLARLLQSLLDMAWPVEVGDLQVKIIVVDNDVLQSARSTVEIFGERFGTKGVECLYVVESEPGIAQARNRAVVEACARASMLAFVDDDEVVSKDWLTSLLAVKARTEADVVAGPVFPLFEGDVPGWIIEGQFFHRSQYSNEAAIKYFATNNVLISTAVFEQLRFDQRLGLAGGSDTLLAIEAADAGYSMRWSTDAVVYEYVPAARANIAWILRRRYRVGTSIALAERIHYGVGRVLATRVAKGILNVGIGVITLPLEVLRGKAAYVNALGRVLRGAGMLAGAMGMVYYEYGERHRASQSG